MKSITLILALFALGSASAGTVVPIPATPDVAADTRFTLKVNGKELFVGEGISGDKYYLVACFDMDGTVGIEATASGSFANFKVMPSRLGPSGS